MVALSSKMTARCLNSSPLSAEPISAYGCSVTQWVARSTPGVRLPIHAQIDAFKTEVRPYKRKAGVAEMWVSKRQLGREPGFDSIGPANRRLSIVSSSVDNKQLKADDALL
jgi:hypothetical protein